MGKKELVTFTNMCMVTDGENVLVQNRTDPGWPGIAFPGGHVEEGESFTASVIREVWEETGLTIEAPRLCGVKDWYDENGRYVVMLYRVDRFTGQLHSSEEGEVFWAPMGDLPDMNLAKGFSDALPVFLNDDVSECRYRIEDGVWHTEIH